jgi:drug/metabolite transporter (DMT)-like permease
VCFVPTCSVAPESLARPDDYKKVLNLTGVLCRIACRSLTHINWEYVAVHTIKNVHQLPMMPSWSSRRSRPSSFEEDYFMRVYYDRGVDTNLIKDPARAWQFVMGAVCAIAAVTIWAGWLVMMRLGLTANLTAFDLTALRFVVAGVVLLPIVLRRGLALNRLGSPGFIAVVIGAGAPVPLLVGAGLSFAPVAHASVLTYGIAPLIVACLAAVALKERLVPIRKTGLVLVGLGGLMIGGLGISSFGGRQSIGHLLFLTAACLWACYAVAIRRARLDGLHAAAIAAVVSLLVYFPLYVTFVDNRLLEVSSTILVGQAFYQGVVTAAVSLALFGRSIMLLGASKAAAFVALTPVMAAVMAIPALGEWPTSIDWLAIGMITAGVYLASGAPVPR